jgi:hypothetical protein
MPMATDDARPGRGAQPMQNADAKHCRKLTRNAVNGLGGSDILVNRAAHQATFKSKASLSRLWKNISNFV